MVLASRPVSWLGPALLACGVIAAVIASTKNRSGPGFFLLGILLGPVGIVCALAARPGTPGS